MMPQETRCLPQDVLYHGTERLPPSSESPNQKPPLFSEVLVAEGIWLSLLHRLHVCWNGRNSSCRSPFQRPEETLAKCPS